MDRKNLWDLLKSKLQAVVLLKKKNLPDRYLKNLAATHLLHLSPLSMQFLIN